MSQSKMAPVKLNVLLLGTTGAGKSATGNMLLTKPAFRTSASISSETTEVDYNVSQIDNFKLMIVDSPALEQSDMSQADNIVPYVNNMKTAVAMCYGFIDAFILVIRFYADFTCGVRETIDSLKNIFGDSFMDHVIVVVTRGDILLSEMVDRHNPLTFNGWCRQLQGAFRELYNDYGGRFVLFNNLEKDKEKKREQIMQVVHLAHDLQTDKGRYTSQCFDDAKERRDRFIEELKAPHLRLEFGKKIDLLSGAVYNYCTNPEEGDKEKIKARIADLKREIDAEDQNYGFLDDLRHRVKDVETVFNNSNKIARLVKELEKLRSAKNTSVAQ